MKTKIILIVLISVINVCLAQNNAKRIPPEKLLTKSIQLSQEQQYMKIIQFIIQYYGKSFKYYEDLKKGDYKIEKQKDGKETQTYLIIIPKGSKQNNPKKIESIKLKMINEDFGTNNSELKLDISEIEKYIDLSKSNSRGIHTNGPIQIVDRRKILFDQMILRNPDIPEEYWWIFNKTFIHDNFENQYGEPSSLFQLCQDGVYIPYGSGNHSKLLTIDNLGHGIVFFDSDINPDNDDPINRVYGYFGSGHGQFMNPMGICLGRSWSYQNYAYYPVYIADQYNFRIVKVTYVFPENSNDIGYFDDNSFSTIDNVSYPYDVGFARGRYHLENDPDLDNSDKVWVSEANSLAPFLSCYSEYGDLMQKFKGYYDANTAIFYDFLPGSAMRLSVYYWSFRVISFVDNVRKCLVSCGLKGDGMADFVENIDGSYITANDIMFFPQDENLNSVKFQMTSSVNSLYPYVWVTSNSKIHCLKMRAITQNNVYYPQTQYLASTDLPYNSQSTFSNLLNSISADNYNDLGTIEAWNYQYGIRRYLPFADVYDDELSDYCDDGKDQMELKGVFTNDCWLQFTAERRKNDGNWESVKIKKVNGEDVNDYLATIYRIAGSTELWDNSRISIQLDLPVSDYLIGGRVKLHMRVSCDNQNPYAIESDFVHNDYEVNVKRNCGPKAGGCPYIYVNDVNDNYTVDNNILHRSEFQEYIGQDILDRYKLNVEPLNSDNAIQIAIAENEDDNSIFDEAKLYYIDHPSGTIIGVTESNDIVVYDPSEVISTDFASLNDNNITSLIQYNTQLGTSGYINDLIIAHYQSSLASSKNKDSHHKINSVKSPKINRSNSEKNNTFSQRSEDTKNQNVLKLSKTNSQLHDESDSIAVIALVGNLDNLIPVGGKTWAGDLFASNYTGEMITTQFARREKLSEVIVPVFNIEASVETVKVNWLSDFNIKYLSVVPIHYNLYSMNEIPLEEAKLNSQEWQVDVTTQLGSIDQNYVNMDLNSYISLKYNTVNLLKIPSGYIRDFIFETAGRYSTSSKNLPLKVINQQIPLTNKLYNNYPNPFNPITTIKYDLAKNSNVKITVYNILGQEVKILVNEFKKAGYYDVKFDGINLASGVYFYRLESGSFTESKKMVLIK